MRSVKCLSTFLVTPRFAPYLSRMDIKHTILLVEDEEEPAEMLENFLELKGYDVLLATTGNRALELIENHAEEIHLAILDIMVPEVDGHEICQVIRNHPVIQDIPVIFLTAKDQEEDEIEGLELGADDYISKPVSLNLIKAHIETLLRRRKPEHSNWLHYGNTYLDTTAKQVYREQERLDLTSTEYTILELFFSNPKRVFSRQEILQHINVDDKYVFDRTVDVHIKNLRIKLGEESDLIKTYRGLGYGLNQELQSVG